MESVPKSLEDIIGIKLSSVQASQHPLPAPGPKDLDSIVMKSLDDLLDSSIPTLRDNAKVERIRSQYSLTEIAASRVFLAMGKNETLKGIISSLMSLDHASRVALCQFATSVGNVPPEHVNRWCVDATHDELKAAQLVGRSSKIVQLTRYNLSACLIKLPPGNSGKLPVAQMLPNAEGYYTNVVWSYGDVKLEFSLDEYATAEIKNLDNFVAALNADGHEVISCIGDPYSDFFVGVFAAMYQVSYDGAAKKMVFKERPLVSRMPFSVQGREIYILSPNGIFRDVVQRMLMWYLQHAAVDQAPADHLAWLWEHRPHGSGSDLATLARAMSKVIKTFQEEWDHRYKTEIWELQNTFIEAFSGLQQGSRTEGGRWSPVSLNQAINSLENARMYRGKEGGKTAASFLNEEMKTVGTEPLGIHQPIISGMHRYGALVDDLVKLGVKDVILYTHLRKVDAEAYFKLKGINLKIYTTAANAPYQHRSFYEHGPMEAERTMFHVVDEILTSVARKGVRPLVAEWNAQAAMYDKVFKYPLAGVIYSRLLLDDSGERGIVADTKLMKTIYSQAKFIAFSFGGVRSHNGEFATWFSTLEPKPFIHKWLPTNIKDLEAIFSILVAVVAARMMFANEARTFAVPCGRWGFSVPGRGHAWALKVAEMVRDRFNPQVRASLMETSTRSSAADFGGKSALEDLNLPPDLVQFLVGEGPKP